MAGHGRAPRARTKAAAPMSRLVAIAGRGEAAAIPPEGRNGLNYMRLWGKKLVSAVAAERYCISAAWKARRPTLS